MDTSSSHLSIYRSSSRTTTSYNPSSTPLAPRAYNYTSPGSALNQSEDPVVIEIGTRYLRAGFANEAAPRCVIPYTEGMWRRVGDRMVDSGKRGGTMLIHKATIASETVQAKKKSSRKSRGELWQYDLRSLDAGLVEDLIERVLREAYNKYLLVDSKTKKVVLPLPPLLPTILIKTITNTIFSQFHPPTITYFSAPVLCTVSAGLRSALVIDIGWHETVITPIYELRVIGGLVGAAGRTKRAGKILRKKTEEILENMLVEKGIEGKKLRENHVEELVQRVVWCENYEVRKRERELRHRTARSKPPISGISLPGTPASTKPTFSTAGPATMLIPLITTDSHKPLSMNVPLSTLSLPVEHAFFEATTCSDSYDSDEPDQDELPLPQLLYNSLLACHIDVRAACLSRIVIVGGPSNILGLKKRIIDELYALVQENGGWNSMKIVQSVRMRRKGASPTVIAENEDERPPPPPPKDGVPPPPPPPKFLDGPLKLSPAEPAEEDIKEESAEEHTNIFGSHDRIRRYKELEERENLKPSQPPGLIRGVKSLGTWAGGSIVAGARVKGICEVEREKFLSAVASGGMGLPSNML
ncbi:actin-domain-containing protein [Tirmania nivea]|nr:actin-domain-containing protein [Tirmania nivea]